MFQCAQLRVELSETVVVICYARRLKIKEVLHIVHTILDCQRKKKYCFFFSRVHNRLLKARIEVFSFITREKLVTLYEGVNIFFFTVVLGVTIGLWSCPLLRDAC